METLSFYDVENAASTTTLDIGTVAPHSSDDSMLRVVNNSGLYQAQDVIVSVTGDDAIQLWLSTDGDTFAASISVGDISPGGSSPTFWLRRVTDSTIGTCSASVQATPARFSDPMDTSTSDNIALNTEDS